MERRHDPLGFTEVVPAHAGNFENREPLGVERQNLVGEVCFVNALIEILNRLRFSMRLKEGGETREGSIEIWISVFDDFK